MWLKRISIKLTCIFPFRNAKRKRHVAYSPGTTYTCIRLTRKPFKIQSSHNLCTIQWMAAACIHFVRCLKILLVETKNEPFIFSIIRFSFSAFSQRQNDKNNIVSVNLNCNKFHRFGAISDDSTKNLKINNLDSVMVSLCVPNICDAIWGSRIKSGRESKVK